MAAEFIPLLLLSLTYSSLAQFVFDFQIHAVTTNGDCSAIFDSDLVDPECETYLNRFCLRRSGHSRSTDDSDCPLGDDGERLGPDFNGLPVPRQILSSQLWDGGFQMFIRAYDQDLDFDDHLDNIFIDMELAESRNFTSVEEFTGEMNRVSVNMTFRVMMCRENFYGSNCDTFCVAQNDEVNGYYTCNGDGSIQCRPGFENTNNSCRDVVNPCTSTPCANNGNCTALSAFNYTCQCAPGYTGPTCEDAIDRCEEVTCPDNSVCVNGSICVCVSGFDFTGELCVLPTTTGNAAGQASAPVIIGAAIGGVLVFLLLLIFLLVVIVVFVARLRRSQTHQKLPDEFLSHSSEQKDTLRFEMTKPTKKDSMMDNPVYDQVSPLHSPTQEQKESSMSISTTNNTSVGASVTVAANPVYGAETAHPKPQRSTVRHVQNPVYGDPSDKNTGDVYSSVDQSSPQPHAGENEQQEYSYAIVEGAARVALSQPATGRDSKTSTTLEQNKSEEDGGFVEHEYAVVDKSAKAQDSTASLHDQTVLPYDQLKHEKSTSAGVNQDQSTIRLAENEDLGYSAFN